FEGEPELCEPDKCEGWDWFDWNELPQPLFTSVATLVRQTGIERLKSGFQDHSISGLQETLRRFFAERDWDQFHSPKNLVMDLASEVGELVDPFRWLTEQQ